MKTGMKRSSVIFIIAVFVILVFPFAAMGFLKSDWSTETTQLAEMPELTEEGSVNTDYLSELGAYFEDHFALRPQMITTNSLVQKNLFGMSSTDQVIMGKDGFLFFAGDMRDYRRTAPMSERALRNSAYNLSLMGDFLSTCGVDMIFTVAPNKSTLYPEYMPYYMLKGEGSSNAERLAPYLEEYGIKYADLFEAFENTDECLYYKEDSHWTNKGAALVYDTVMEKAAKEERAELTAYEPAGKISHSGDLSEMLWPQIEAYETDLDYAANSVLFDYKHETEVEDYMDDLILTSCAGRDGSLYMFRDSFGTGMIPFFASTYGQACFSRLVPYNLPDVISRGADTVIIEKVERNLSSFAERGAVMQGPIITDASAITELSTAEAVESNTEISFSSDGPYYVISGTIDPSLFNDNTDIYIRVTDETSGVPLTYKPFYISYEAEDGTVCDNGFSLNIFNDGSKTGNTDIQVIVKNDNTCSSVASAVMQYNN